MKIATIGIDLGKSTFHLVGFDEEGRIVARKRCSRLQLIRFMVTLPPCHVGMEACSGAHLLGHQLSEQGHDVRLMPPQYVRPFVKSNKNDFIDAEAIAEAVQRPTMRFVPLKTLEQLDLQAFHRVRERLVTRRTAVINQIRAFLLERGLVLRQGRAYLARVLPGVLSEPTPVVSERMRVLLSGLWTEWKALDVDISRTTREIETLAMYDPACQRLTGIPGVGPVIATALVAAVGTGAAFAKGRDFAAWLGLVPQQHSTGGKPRLLGISKRGNSYLRRLFVQGARSILLHTDLARHTFGPWLTALRARVHHNVAVIALANKLARIAWAVLVRQEPYRGIAQATI
jgi:transposase